MYYKAWMRMSVILEKKTNAYVTNLMEEKNERSSTYISN